MPNDNTITLGEPNYESKYKQLADENRWLKEEIDRLHQTIVEMCIWQFTSRFKN